MWLKIFLYLQYNNLEPIQCFFYDRKSNIPSTFINYQCFVHTGKSWNPFYINRWMLGLKFGSFTWNRRLAIFKVKQLKKKK